MPRKTFDTDYGDYGRADTNDGEFLRRIGECARRYGYAIESIEVCELPAKRDETRWIDDERLQSNE